MSLRSRNSKLQEKIALFEEREKQLAAKQAALRTRTIVPKEGAISKPGEARARPISSPSGSNISNIISRLPISQPQDEHHPPVRRPGGPSRAEDKAKSQQRDKEEEEKEVKDQSTSHEDEEYAQKLKEEMERTAAEAKAVEEERALLLKLKREEEEEEERMRRLEEEEERRQKEEEEEEERRQKEKEEERRRRLEQQQQRKEEEERAQRAKEEEEERERRRKEEEAAEERRRKLEEAKKARLLQEEKEAKAATCIQARWRARCARRRFQIMLKMNVYRTQVVEEILSTEETYVTTLREVVDLMVKPLKEAVASGKPIISNDEIKTIFSNIQIILGYNDALLEDLRKKMSSWHPSQTIGEVFLTMAAFMKVYTDYVRNFNDALSMIQECKKSPDFVNFLTETYPKMSVVQADISSYLITPVQRIPRYQLLLRDLLKHTWKDHSDYASLEQALQQITTTAIYVNDKQKEAENIQKMLSIQGSLYGKKLVNLVDPHRRFLREGGLMEIKAKGKGKPRWFILFNDLLVKCNMTNTMKKKTFKKGSSPSFEYLGQLSLEGCELVNSGDEGDKKYGFQVNTSSSSLWLCAASEDEKAEWMKDIKECIKSLKEKSDFYDEQATKIAAQRAAAAKALIAEQYTGYRVRGTYAPPSGGKRTSEYRRTPNGILELVDDGEQELNKSSMRALSAQERFQLAKQAEQRLSQLLEEEKQQEQMRQDVMNERVKYFKDSMGKRYSSSTESLGSLVENGGSDDDDEGSESGVNSEMSEGTETPTRSGSIGSIEEESLTDSGQRGRRRFASMKREHYRGSSANSKTNSLQNSPKEERDETTAPSPPTSAKADSPVAAPRTRKFASLKREDYRSARGSRYSSSGSTPVVPASATAPTSTSITAAATTVVAVAATVAAQSTSIEEENDVVIHEDQAPVGVPAYLKAQKRNFATGRRNYPSVHSKELIKNATEEFGDVTDILSQMKQSKADTAKAKKTGNSSLKKDDFENFKMAVQMGSDDDEEEANGSGKSKDVDAGTSEKKTKKKKQQTSIKREEYKAQQAAFAAIELKDMVAVVKQPPNGDGAPKRRFASMKRENYKSFQQAADKESGDGQPNQD